MPDNVVKIWEWNRVTHKVFIPERKCVAADFIYNVADING